MKKLLLFLFLAMAVPAFGIDLSFEAGQFVMTESDTESNWAAAVKVRTCENLWIGVGIENGSRKYIVELYEYDLYSASATYYVPLNDKIKTFIQLAYYRPHVQQKSETTREGFSMLNTDLKTALPRYDRIDVSLDPGFGGEIGLEYAVTDRFSFLAAYRMLQLDEHLMGYCGAQNSWIEGKHNFSGPSFWIRYVF